MIIGSSNNIISGNIITNNNDNGIFQPINDYFYFSQKERRGIFALISIIIILTGINIFVIPQLGKGEPIDKDAFIAWVDSVMQKPSEQTETKVIEYFVSGEKLQVVDIPPGYTHSIENLGKIDLVTVIWVNEIFNPKNPDTFYMEVENEKN